MQVRAFERYIPLSSAYFTKKSRLIQSSGLLKYSITTSKKNLDHDSIYIFCIVTRGCFTNTPES